MGLLDVLRGRAKAEVGGGIVRVGGASFNATWSYTRVLNSVYANPTGYRCVESIANEFQRPTWETRKPNTEETQESQLLKVLRKPAPGKSGTQMQSDISHDLDLAGKSYWLKLRGTNGESDTGPLTGLKRLAVQRVTTIANDEDELMGFVYTDRMGRRYGVLPHDMVYLNYASPERETDGLAPAIVAGLPAETDTAAARFNFDLLSNDSALPGYISVEGLTPGQFAEWKAAWESGEVAGKTRFLGGNNAKYVKVGQTNQELTYHDLRTDSREDICRSFGWPRVLIDPTEATFANMAAARNGAILTTVLPRWTKVADQMTIQLGEEEGVEVGFDLSEIDELNEALDALVTRNVQLLDRQVITINEVREELGLEAVAWGNVPLAPQQAFGMMSPAPSRQPQPEPEQNDEQQNQGDDTQASLTVTTSKGIQDDTPAEDAPPEWHEFDRRVTKYEERASRRMEKFFERQANAIVKRLESRAGKSMQKAAEEWWDGDRWNAELTDESAAFLEDSVDAFATFTLGRLPTNNPYDPRAERVRQFIDGRSNDLAGLVNGTTADEVRAVISAAQAEGVGMAEIAKRVRGYFADNASTRATVVARTEVIGASNFGVLEGARQSGLAVAKTWLAANDGRVDEDCAALDGVKVGIDDTWDGLDAPPHHPQCRCSMTIQLDTGEETNE